MIEYGIVFGVATAFIPIALTISMRIGESKLNPSKKNCLFRWLGISIFLGAAATLLLIAAIWNPSLLDTVRIALILIVFEVFICSLVVALFLIRGSEEGPRSKPATSLRK
jgi:hypothetical protein